MLKAIHQRVRDPQTRTALHTGAEQRANRQGQREPGMPKLSRSRDAFSHWPRLAGVAVLLLTAGCDREPEFVYVLEAPQTVAVSASASATRVTTGGPVGLHATRRTSGTWKRIAIRALTPRVESSYRRQRSW